MIERIADANNLYEAFRRSKSGSTWKESVQRYEMDFLRNIYRTRKEILDGTYKQKPFYEFTLCERGKSRNIRSMHISDRVVQRSVCDYILLPELTKYLIYDNGASLKGKGVDFTRRRIETHLHRYYRRYGSDGYILLVDFSGFFDSIPHDGLMDSIRAKIRDEEMIAFIQAMVDSFGDVSVGIGSQISQVAGIYYPTRIDNYCKIVRSLKFYGRYMDDIYIMHPDKHYLRKLEEEICRIADEMGLAVNREKTQIIKLTHGFTFLKMKYTLTETGKVLRRPAPERFTRERRRLKKFIGIMPYEDIEQAYKSWRGNLTRYQTYRSLRNMDRLFDELFIEPFKRGETI